MIASAKEFKSKIVAGIVARMFLQSDFLNDFNGKVRYSKEYKKNQRFIRIGKNANGLYVVEFHSIWGYVEESYLAECFRQFLAKKSVREQIAFHPEILKRMKKEVQNIVFMRLKAQDNEELFSDDRDVKVEDLQKNYASFMKKING